MERDFLGLNPSKDSVTVVENDVKDSSKDSVFMRGSVMQWPFSNKVSALPQLMPFKAVQDERSKRTDSFVSPGFMSITSTDAFDANHKAFNAVIQKNFNIDKQVSSHYPITTYPGQQVDEHLGNRSHDVRAFSVPNHTISVAMSNPFFKNMGNNYGATSMKQQSLGGVPIPTSNTVVSGSDQRNILKPAGTSAQLTIFYGGSVSVYDDVSPEKAQAIMFLAGNGVSVNPSVATPRAPAPGPTPKQVAGDGIHGNPSHSTSPCSGLSSPISVTSHATSQSANGSSGTDEVILARSIGAMTVSTSLPEPPKAVTSIKPTTNLMPAAVPQARKASLARFLEKRKERVMSTTPYNIPKKSPEGTMLSNSVSFTGSSGAAVFAPSSKEQSLSLGPANSESKGERLQISLEM
ncbi:hypothetical protein Sjap_024663 [Stephania japonica]|uniref:Protein TIFY n=1 Tax=Stephania japonica TaxID=461633 RepID=A0AAP0HP62_9MAGN